MKGQPREIQDLLKSLAKLLGNEGWVDGLLADLVKAGDDVMVECVAGGGVTPAEAVTVKVGLVY